MKSSESLFIVIKTKNLALVFRNIRTSTAKNEINPHLTKEMMLLYIQMFTKLGDDFEHNFLKEIVKNIYKISLRCSFMDCPSQKIIVSKEQIKSTKSPLIFKSQGLFIIK